MHIIVLLLPLIVTLLLLHVLRHRLVALDEIKSAKLMSKIGVIGFVLSIPISKVFDFFDGMAAFSGDSLDMREINFITGVLKWLVVLIAYGQFISGCCKYIRSKNEVLNKSAQEQ